MKKSTRRKISLSIIAILCIILIISAITLLIKFAVSIFNKVGNKTKKSTDNGYIETTIGKDLSLPKELANSNLELLSSDKIIKQEKETNKKTGTLTTTIIVHTSHSVEEIITHFKSIIQNPMVSSNENLTQIIGGFSDELIKVRIEKDQYTVTLEAR